MQVDQTEQREREAMGREQLELQGEGHDVGIGRRQAAVVGEMAQSAIGRQVVGLNPQETAQAGLGQSVAADTAFAQRPQVKAGACVGVVQVVP